MKKIIICITVFCSLLFTACNPDPDGGSSDVITKPEGIKPEGTGTSPTSNRNTVYIGESTETEDGLTYTVKKYADIYGGSDYFYKKKLKKILKSF